VHELTIGFPPDWRQPYPAQADYARKQMPDHRTDVSVCFSRCCPPAASQRNPALAQLLPA